jgi:hypothetical protein
LDCKDEEEFLQMVSEFIEEIKVDTAEYLEDWGSENQFTVTQYRKKLKMLVVEIQKVKNIPIDKRIYEKW